MKLKKRNNLGLPVLTLSIVLLFIFSVNASSQDDDKLDKNVWTLQAESTGQALSLQKKSQKKLTKAYLEFRTEISEKGDQQSDGAIQKSLDGFVETLGSFLAPEEAEKAGFLLGSLNNRWDQYLGILIGYGLEEESLNLAATAVYEYTDVYLQERKKASDANTRFSGRTATALKAGLDKKISPLIKRRPKC